MCKEMSNEKFNKITELINKLLAITTENGASENEVIIATLRVQEILARYDMELSDITTDRKENITESVCETSNDVWRFSLAKVIADNFCCKVYTSNKKTIKFYGYKRHCDTAKEVFLSLYNYGRKQATITYKRISKERKNMSGIKNQFYVGFVHGVKQALDAQSRALMVVTPPEVIESFDDLCDRINMRTKKATMSYRTNSEAYDSGVAAGKSAASRKEIAV